MRALCVFALMFAGCGRTCQCDFEGMVIQCGNMACVDGDILACAADGTPSTVAGGCGQTPAPRCTPDCSGRQCGDDGCGGSCGTCDPTAFSLQCSPSGDGIDRSSDLQCSDGKCVFTSVDFIACAHGCNATTNVSCCQPACSGKQCGDDGCGGSCGSCAAGTKCDGTQCVACTANCSGKLCGDDGCGGSCGGCPTGKVCGIGGPSDGRCCVGLGDPCPGGDGSVCCSGLCGVGGACAG